MLLLVSSVIRTYSRIAQDAKGGHFAAHEVPEAFWKDIEDFLGVAWRMEENVKSDS